MADHSEELGCRGEYTFLMKEVVSREWTLTCQADTQQEAFAMAQHHMGSDIHQWARTVRPPSNQEVISQNIEAIP